MRLWVLLFLLKKKGGAHVAPSRPRRSRRDGDDVRARALDPIRRHVRARDEAGPARDDLEQPRHRQPRAGQAVRAVCAAARVSAARGQRGGRRVRGLPWLRRGAHRPLWQEEEGRGRGRAGQGSEEGRHDGQPQGGQGQGERRGAQRGVGRQGARQGRDRSGQRPLALRLQAVQRGLHGRPGRGQEGQRHRPERQEQLQGLRGRLRVQERAQDRQACRRPR